MNIPACQLAIIQHSPVFLNLPASIEKAVSLIDTAAKDGANIIVFPETWLPGYPVWLDFSPGAALWNHPPAKTLYRLLAENSPEIPGPEIAQLQEAAQKTKTYLVMGLHERWRGTLYNTMLYISPDGSYESHRKLMPTYTERLVWGRGDGSTLAVLDTPFGKLGGLICWEHWMPLARAAMHAKQEAIHIAQWPMVKSGNLLASRHYAFEGQCFVAAAGCVLSKQEILEGAASVAGKKSPALDLLKEMPVKNEEQLLKGGSAIIAPSMKCIAGPTMETAEIIQATLNPELLLEGRLFMDADGHYARPDVFQLTVNEQAQDNVRFEGK